MNIEIRKYGGQTVISPSGDIDMYSSPELRNEIMRGIRERVPIICIDFRAVSYIDSSGIATFVEGLKGMKSYGGRLKLVRIPEPIMEVFRFSKLETIFEIYGEIDDAISR